MGIFCGTCKDVVETAIKDMPSELTCTAAAAAIVAAIEVAGGGPEDPVADALSAVAVAVIESLCLEYGWPWIRSHRSDVAEAMCKEAGLC